VRVGSCPYPRSALFTFSDGADPASRPSPNPARASSLAPEWDRCRRCSPSRARSVNAGEWRLHTKGICLYVDEVGCVATCGGHLHKEGVAADAGVVGRVKQRQVHQQACGCDSLDKHIDARHGHALIDDDRRGQLPLNLVPPASAVPIRVIVGNPGRPTSALRLRLMVKVLVALVIQTGAGFPSEMVV
jgi:hypothetical protein